MANNPGTAPTLGNRYQLLQTLGKGGMADVYRAWDGLLERPVAIKVLRSDFTRTPEFRERFRQEARSVANLSHPNIVTVHDFGFDSDRLYIVMEYVPGTDLKTMIKQRGRFTMSEAIPLIVQACDGIGYAHRAGLVHCDVKPHNMLVTPDQRLKVTDFGIARALASIHPDEQYDVVWGSPQYFSPEQAAGAAPSPASDVYSLGVILYEMLTGELPFNSHDPVELARLHREVKPVPPRRLNRDIPPPLEQIILKVLSKEPASRYRSADQLGRILANFSQLSNMQPVPNLTPVPASNLPPTPISSPIIPSIQTRSAKQDPVYMQPESYSSQPLQTRSAAIPQIDWLTIGLGLLALIAAGGLIPFWIYVWLQITSLPTP